MAKNLIELSDLEAMGLDLTTEDAQAKATAWIEYASEYLRLIAYNNGLDLDQKLVIDSAAGGTYGAVVKMVITNAVMRGNATNVEAPDATQFSQTATPYAETIHYSAEHNEAFFKQKELDVLGFSSVSGRSQFSVLEGLRG